MEELGERSLADQAEPREEQGAGPDPNGTSRVLT